MTHAQELDMSHFLTPTALAAAAALAVPPPLPQRAAEAPMFVGRPMVDDPTVADEASVPVVYQPRTGDSDLWHSRVDLSVMA
jgi:hypothetical protein